MCTGFLKTFIAGLGYILDWKYANYSKRHSVAYFGTSNNINFPPGGKLILFDVAHHKTFKPFMFTNYMKKFHRNLIAFSI